VRHSSCIDGILTPTTQGVEIFDKSKFVEDTMGKGEDETAMESIHEEEGDSHFAEMNKPGEE